MGLLDKLTSQAEQVEILNFQEESTSIDFENNRLKTSVIEETKGTAVRIVKDGRLGFSASTDDSAEDKLISNVLESAAYGDEVPILFPNKAPLVEVKNFDEKIVDLPIQTMVEMGQEVVDTFMKMGPELKVNVRIKRRNRNVGIKNQSGLDLKDNSSPFSMGYELFRIDRE